MYRRGAYVRLEENGHKHDYYNQNLEIHFDGQSLIKSFDELHYQVYTFKQYLQILNLQPKNAKIFHFTFYNTYKYGSNVYFVYTYSESAIYSLKIFALIQTLVFIQFSISTKRNKHVAFPFLWPHPFKNAVSFLEGNPGNH